MSKEVEGGTHITFEIILKIGNNYIALKRKNIPGHYLAPDIEKKGQALFFCHDLILYGESTEACVKRIVKEQAKVSITKYRVVYLESNLLRESGGRKRTQWAIVPHVIAEVSSLPKKDARIKEVILFNKENIPDDFAWWKKEELRDFLEEFGHAI